MAFVQIPVFITMFFAIRRMANEEYEILQQGFWWIPKLCEADPTYAIPVLTSATMLLTVEVISYDSVCIKEHTQIDV